MCTDTAPYNLKGAILKDSYLDIRGIPHLAVLPNLELFANAGYPFTRKADLSDTAVVLPDTSGPDEIEMYLTLMGHFGAQTGYPVLNVGVTNADGMKTDGRKDYLVLGTVEDQPALSKLNPSLPVMVDGSGLHIQDTQGFFAPLQHAWWKVRSSDHIQSGQLETAGGLAGCADRRHRVAERLEPVGRDRGAARPYRGAELPVGVPEVLAVVGHLAVGERAARRRGLSPTGSAMTCIRLDRSRRGRRSICCSPSIRG